MFNGSVIKTYSLDAVTIDLVKGLANRMSRSNGRDVSQGEVIRVAVKGLADRLDEEDEAEAEVIREDEEDEAAAEFVEGLDYE